jgi:hypothetical protein
MKRGKIILKKESKPEQKKSHKKSPKLNHQLQKKHHPPATPALLRGSHRKRRAGAGVNAKLRRNKQKALAFVPDRAHYFCIISSN